MCSRIAKINFLTLAQLTVQIRLKLIKPLVCSKTLRKTSAIRLLGLATLQNAIILIRPKVDYVLTINKFFNFLCKFVTSWSSRWFAVNSNKHLRNSIAMISNIVICKNSYSNFCSDVIKIVYAAGL